MRKQVIAWLFVTGLMIFGIGGSSAQSGVRVVVVNEFLNVRVTPAIGAPVIGTVEAGYVFDIITARSGDDQWLRVDYLCSEGWINIAPLVILEGDIFALPTHDPRSMPFGGFEAPRSGITTASSDILGRATDGLRIRSGPSTGYPTIGNINFNQQFYITGRNRCGSWIQVNFEGTLGWVSATFVEQIGPGNIQTLPEGGVVAEAATPQIDGDQEYFATLRLMLSRLDIAQISLDSIRSSWTDAALSGRAICQDYPARPSDFPIASPLLAANYGVLEPLRVDFNSAMQDIRDAIDLFIQVCNQPGTGNPVGTTTVEGALNTINRADQTVLSLRQRLNSLIPDLSVGVDECLLVFNRAAEVLPLVQFGVVYGDEITRRTYARGYCFNGIENQVVNFQALPIPPAQLNLFVAISAIDNPTDFLAINIGPTGLSQTVGPIILPSTGQYLLIIADLQEDSSTRTSFGNYAFLLSDLTFGTSFRNLIYDEGTNSVVLQQQADFSVGIATEPIAAVCPNISFACSGLFSCDEARACLQQGNFNLDPNGDGVPCNEVGNLLLNTTQCQ